MRGQGAILQEEKEIKTQLILPDKKFNLIFWMGKELMGFSFSFVSFLICFFLDWKEFSKENF